MSHLSATKLTFSPKWDTMDDDERLAEQVATYEIVSKCGGEIKAQYVLWSDNCLFAITDYPVQAPPFADHQSWTTSTPCGSFATTDTVTAGDPQRYYRIRRTSPAVCECP